MQNKLIAKIAKKQNLSIEKVEENWNKAAGLSTTDNPVYISGIFKKMMGEALTFKEFLVLVEEDSPTNTSDGTMPNHKATDGKPTKKKPMMKRKKKGKDDDTQDEN